MKKASKKNFSVSLIGYPVLPDSGNKLPTQKAQALLLYLITEKVLNEERVISKEKIIDLLWPGMPSTSALQNLRQTIYQIRKTYDIPEDTTSSILQSDRKSVWLNEEYIIHTDLDWVHLITDQKFAQEHSGKKMIELYARPFLEHFNIPNTPFYDEWIDQCRVRLANLHQSLLEQEILEETGSKKDDDLIPLLEFLISRDPYTERYHQKYIRHLADKGKRNRAIKAYHHYQQIMAKELGADPSPKMQQLYQELRNRRAVDGPMALKENGTVRMRLLALGLLAVTIVIMIFFLNSNELPKRSQEQRIAILPMKNHTDKEFLADGITDEILAGLTKVQGIKMISRQSTFSYKETTKTPSAIGQELSVNYLLRGTLSQLNNQYKVSIQFLESATGEVLWAETFDQDTAQIAALQRLITTRISDHLNRHFGKTHASPQLEVATQSSAAYHAYLQGRYSFYQANPKSLHEAIEHFQKALSLDPHFSLAHAWLAWTYCSLAGSWGDQLATDMYPKVKKELAFIKDNQELRSMYYKISGWMHFWLLDRESAENYLRQAVAIDPNEEFGLSALAMVLTLRKEFEEATRIAEQALDLNPHFFWNHFVLGQALYYKGEHEEALKVIENGLALFRNHEASIGIYSRLLVLTGKPDEAIDFLKQRLDQHETPPASIYADLGLAYAAVGDLEKAKNVAEALLLRYKEKEKYTAYFAAKIYSVLGEEGTAVYLLEKAFQDRDNELNWLEVDIEFKPLYQNPGFKRLLARLGNSHALDLE